MSIERIGLTHRWCDAAIFNGIVFLAGHIAEKTEGRSLTEQTEEVLALLEETLESAGSAKDLILSVQIFLTDISKIAEMNAVYDKWVAPGHAPTRATVGAQLASPGHAIEITAVAAKRSAA
uniref:Enamine deaminase RidA, house cleaning of reactive enamine intermediates, YjgF/YER057c/UK114 family n=1 Tax=Bosea lathyri TaxID=1036778 RepID=A0A1H6DE14_9HYPH|nr:RidA family protein [Bosea lathyri]SEG83451.1 Enamine deaminase RidA, house cleaning of reactive enamine intermediates, YjgF/YER057c/UK114 family [Bosea lathyri]